MADSPPSPPDLPVGFPQVSPDRTRAPQTPQRQQCQVPITQPAHVLLNHLYKEVLSKMNATVAAAQYGGDASSIPVEQRQAINQKAKLLAWQELNKRARLLQQQKAQQHQLRRQPLRYPTAQDSPTPQEAAQLGLSEQHLADLQYVLPQQYPARNQSPVPSLPPPRSPAEGQKTPEQYPVPSKLGHAIQFSRSQTPVHQQVPEALEDCKNQLEILQNNLRHSINHLNGMHLRFRMDPKCAMAYPFQQNKVVQIMYSSLAVRSGLAALTVALQGDDRQSFYHLTQSTAAKLDTLLPELQNIVRSSLASIMDTTSKHTAINKTFTMFYEAFGAIKARLCVEDRRRRSSQERLADTLKYSRLQVWHYLEPQSDEELEEGLTHVQGGQGYGSGYVTGTGGVMPASQAPDLKPEPEPLNRSQAG